MEELKWTDIKGFEGKYEISNHGHVRNKVTMKVLTPEVTRKGYLRVGLLSNGDRTRKLVHVLVAEHFIPNYDKNQTQVNHKDMNKGNNHVNNLEWCSGSENVQHKIANDSDRLDYLISSMSHVGKKFGHLGAEASKKPVAQIDVSTGKIVAIYPSAREAAKITGANYKNISQVCQGEKKTHFGYRWSFSEKS